MEDGGGGGGGGEGGGGGVGEGGENDPPPQKKKEITKQHKTKQKHPMVGCKAQEEMDRKEGASCKLQRSEVRRWTYFIRPKSTTGVFSLVYESSSLHVR